jgi:hypothetical protein
MQVQYIGNIVDGLTIPARVVSPLALPDTATLAQAASALGVWASAVDACIDGAFEQVYCVLTPPLPGGLKMPTGATFTKSDVTLTGNIQFSATGTTQRFGLALPSFTRGAITSGRFDLTNTNVVALLNLLLNPTGFFTNWSQQSLEATLDAWLAFRQRTIRRKRTKVL